MTTRTRSGWAFGCAALAAICLDFVLEANLQSRFNWVAVLGVAAALTAVAFGVAALLARRGEEDPKPDMPYFAFGFAMVVALAYAGIAYLLTHLPHL